VCSSFWFPRACLMLYGVQRDAIMVPFAEQGFFSRNWRKHYGLRPGPVFRSAYNGQNSWLQLRPLGYSKISNRINDSFLHYYDILLRPWVVRRLLSGT